jgi:hypothetical protein
MKVKKGFVPLYELGESKPKPATDAGFACYRNPCNEPGCPTHDPKGIVPGYFACDLHNDHLSAEAAKRCIDSRKS